MRKTFIVSLSLVCLLLILNGCGSSQGGVTVNPATSAIIDITRAAARSLAYVEIQKHGVPQSVAAATVKTLQATVDARLAGGNAMLILDPLLWAPVRQGLVDDIATAVVGLEANGAKVFEPESAKFLAEQIVSLIEVNLRRIVQRG